MVVGHFRGIEHFLRLRKWLAFERLRELLIAPQTSECLRAFGIDIVAEEGRIHTRIGGELLLVEALNQLQGLFGRVAEFAVAIHLQGSQVIQSWRCFRSFLLLNVRHGERLAFDGMKDGQSLFFCLIFNLSVNRSFAFDGLSLLGSRFHFGSIFSLSLFIVSDGGEFGVAIESGEHPTLFGHKTLDFLLATHDERQRGGLHAPDGEHLFLLSVFERVEAGGVHAKCPVADGATKSCLVE